MDTYFLVLFSVEEYERSWEQNEELGLNDMDTSAADAAYEWLIKNASALEKIESVNTWLCKLNRSNISSIVCYIYS